MAAYLTLFRLGFELDLSTQLSNGMESMGIASKTRPSSPVARVMIPGDGDHVANWLPELVGANLYAAALVDARDCRPMISPTDYVIMDQLDQRTSVHDQPCIFEGHNKRGEVGLIVALEAIYLELNPKFDSRHRLISYSEPVELFQLSLGNGGEKATCGGVKVPKQVSTLCLLFNGGGVETRSKYQLLCTCVLSAFARTVGAGYSILRPGGVGSS